MAVLGLDPVLDGLLNRTSERLDADLVLSRRHVVVAEKVIGELVTLWVVEDHNHLPLATICKMSPDVIAAIGGVAAAVIAFLAWRTNTDGLRFAYRPALRPVPLRYKQTGFLDPTRFLLKNIGRGPAVGIHVYERSKTGDRLIASVDVVEPLGQPLGTGEESRIGRVEVKLTNADFLTKGLNYRVVYQNLEGQWHESGFRVGEEQFEQVRYLGVVQSWGDPSRSVPEHASALAFVVEPEERG